MNSFTAGQGEMPYDDADDCHEQPQRCLACGRAWPDHAADCSDVARMIRRDTESALRRDAFQRAMRKQGAA